MKNVLPILTIIGALVAVPGALAGGPQGLRLITDTLGGNGHAQGVVDNPYATTGSASASLRGYTTSGPKTHAAAGAPRGYHFITDTLAPGGGTSQQTTIATVRSSFSWGDAGIGAAAAAGALLSLLGASLLTIRRRSRVAVQSVLPPTREKGAA